ncbi:MAG: hypothetical protein ACE5SW_08645 [Nitrososphaeraceae archaeon]
MKSLRFNLVFIEFTRLKSDDCDIVIMALPKGMENRSAGNQNNSDSNGMQNWHQFTQCWAGMGIWMGIWAVTFGIISSGILMR